MHMCIELMQQQHASLGNSYRHVTQLYSICRV